MPSTARRRCRLLTLGAFGITGWLAVVWTQSWRPRTLPERAGRTGVVAPAGRSAPVAVTGRSPARSTAAPAGAPRSRAAWAEMITTLRAADAVEVFTLLDERSDADAALLFDAYSEALAPLLAAREFTLARELITTTPRPDVREQLLAAFLDTWGRVEPAAAAGWMAPMRDDAAASRQLATIVSEWAAREPAAALGFAVALPAGNQRCAAVGGVITQWAARAPEPAERWLQAAAATCPDLRPLLDREREPVKVPDGSPADG